MKQLMFVLFLILVLKIQSFACEIPDFKHQLIQSIEKSIQSNCTEVLLNKENIDKGFVVFCHLKLIQHTKEFVTTFEHEVTQLKEVLECYHVSGDYDYILKIVVKDMKSYREFLLTKLTTLQHIGSTQSTFMISEVKNTTVVEV